MNIPTDAIVTGASDCSTRISNGILVITDNGVNSVIAPSGTVTPYLEFATSDPDYEVTFLQFNGIQMNLTGETVEPTAIFITEEEVTLFTNQTHEFFVRYEPYNGEGTITWSSSNTAIATITSDTGLLTAVSPGECTITATCGSLTSTADIIVQSNIVQTSNLEIQFVISGNPWAAGSGFNVMYTVNVHNISDETISHWECDVVLPAGSSYNSGWNSTVTNTSGTTYHIVGPSFTIAPGATNTSTGMVFIVPTTSYIPIPINITP